MIRQWPINWCTSPIMTHKFIFSGWNVWTVNLMNQPINILKKFQSLLSRQIRKHYYKTLGTSVITSPLSSLYLWYTRLWILHAPLPFNSGSRVVHLLCENFTLGHYPVISYFIQLHANKSGILRDRTLAQQLMIYKITLSVHLNLW